MVSQPRPHFLKDLFQENVLVIVPVPQKIIYCSRVGKTGTGRWEGKMRMRKREIMCTYVNRIVIAISNITVSFRMGDIAITVGT